MGVPATGKTAQITGIDISHLADGKIVEPGMSRTSLD